MAHPVDSVYCLLVVCLNGEKHKADSYQTSETVDAKELIQEVAYNHLLDVLERRQILLHPYLPKQQSVQVCYNDHHKRYIFTITTIHDH